MYSEPCQTSKMELLQKELTAESKKIHLDVWHGCEYASKILILKRQLFIVSHSLNIDVIIKQA